MKESHITAVGSHGNKLTVFLHLFQGSYFALLGIWPILDIHSFQAVTGPKTDHLITGDERDHWLVVTVGALIVVIGLVLLMAAFRQSNHLEIRVLAAMSALALLLIDVTYVYRHVLAPVYLVDAAIELMFLVGWLLVFLNSKKNVDV
jgi:hypothetical protein